MQRDDPTEPSEAQASARLAKLQGHPDLPAALEDVPPSERRAGAGLPRLAVVLGILLGTAILTIATGLFFAPAALVPLVLGLLGVYAVLRGAREDARYDRAPVEAVPAVVVRAGVQVVDTGRSQGTTRHVLSLATPAGARDVPLETRLAGRLAPGAAGVAYVKEGMLLAFRALELEGPARS